MHELSIAMALVEQVEAVVRERKAAGVAKVSVTVGALSGVDSEALREAFPLAAEGSVVAGADLVIEGVEAAVRCRGCGKRSRPEPPFICCGECGSGEVDLEAGRELYIHAIDIDVEEGVV